MGSETWFYAMTDLMSEGASYEDACANAGDRLVDLTDFAFNKATDRVSQLRKQRVKEILERRKL